MTIFEYLQAKYGEKGPQVLTSLEAQAFGIKYPLQSGWVQEHGEEEISRTTAKILANKLQQKGERSGSILKSNYCLSGAHILRGIGK